MTRVNWARLIAGGMIATLICFATDGVMHERLLHADWQAVFEAISARQPQKEARTRYLLRIFGEPATSPGR